MDIFAETFATRISKSFLNAYQMGAEFGNMEIYEDPAKKQSFKDHFAKLCKIEQSLVDENNLIQRFACTSVDDFDKEYRRDLAEVKENARSVLETERFVKFAADIDGIVVLGENIQDTQQPAGTAAAEDEDIQMEESQLLETDPFSKQPIRDPVKNIRCNHVYDRESIMTAIRTNKRTKCAYVGCSNKQPVLSGHLQEDPVLKAKLDQMYTQRSENVMYAAGEGRNSSGAEEGEEDDEDDVEVLDDDSDGN